jgi:hypothetical protein
MVLEEPPCIPSSGPVSMARSRTAAIASGVMSALSSSR